MPDSLINPDPDILLLNPVGNSPKNAVALPHLSANRLTRIYPDS